MSIASARAVGSMPAADYVAWFAGAPDEVREEMEATWGPAPGRQRVHDGALVFSGVDLGESDLEPEIVMTADADVAHMFWLGRVNVTVALARGQMKADGPVAKILKLVPLIKPVFPRYRELLEREGRTDLLEV